MGSKAPERKTRHLLVGEIEMKRVRKRVAMRYRQEKQRRFDSNMSGFVRAIAAFPIQCECERSSYG